MKRLPDWLPWAILGGVGGFVAAEAVQVFSERKDVDAYRRQGAPAGTAGGPIRLGQDEPECDPGLVRQPAGFLRFPLCVTPEVSRQIDTGSAVRAVPYVAAGAGIAALLTRAAWGKWA